MGVTSRVRTRGLHETNKQSGRGISCGEDLLGERVAEDGVPVADEDEVAGPDLEMVWNVAVVAVGRGRRVVVAVVAGILAILGNGD